MPPCQTMMTLVAKSGTKRIERVMRSTGRPFHHELHRVRDEGGRSGGLMFGLSSRQTDVPKRTSTKNKKCARMYSCQIPAWVNALNVNHVRDPNDHKS